MQIRKQYQEQKDRAIIKSFKDAGDLKGLDYYLVLTALLQAEAFVFSSDYGKKGIDNLTTAQRIKNQITDAGNLKEFCNYNLFTGYGNIADIDLDTKETRVLADAFLAPTGMEFGRASTPRSHRLYKIIDLTKKHGRKLELISIIRCALVNMKMAKKQFGVKQMILLKLLMMHYSNQ